MPNSGLMAVREALAAAIAPVIRSSKIVDSQINPPCAIIVPGGAREDGRVVIKYDHTMANGSHMYTFTIKIVVGTVVDRVSQALLDEYISPNGAKSLHAAIDADMSLGGVVSYARAHSVIHYGMLRWNDIQYVGADLLVEAIT